MKQLIQLSAVALLLAACASNPYTGRSQLLLLSETEEVSMGVQAFAEVSKQEPTTNNVSYTAPLLRVGKAIAAQADRMRAEQGKEPYDWEFKVIKADDTLNAWCMPGGKIAFYTGIYPVLEDEAGMAIVMGHEVCHALLRHGGERVSTSVLQNAGMQVASVFVSGTETANLTMAALGMGSQVGIMLPFSRSHETEADKLGLELAARAGYDPRAAIRVWENMSSQGGGRPPEILSTHPDPDNRIANMKQWMPEALRLYEQSKKQPNYRLPGAPVTQ